MRSIALGLAIALAVSSVAAQPKASAGAGGRAGDAADTDQITTSMHGAATVGEGQLSERSRDVTAPLSGLTPTDGRSTSIAGVDGRDRCEGNSSSPAVTEACAHILDSRAADFPGPDRSGPAATFDPDKDASGLVDDVVNGGTGTVVTLPSPR